VLLHFKSEGLFLASDLVADCDSVENFWNAVYWEGSVDDGADDLDDFTVCAHDD